MQIREIGVKRDLQIGKGLKFSTVVNLQKILKAHLQKRQTKHLHLPSAKL